MSCLNHGVPQEPPEAEYYGEFASVLQNRDFSPFISVYPFKGVDNGLPERIRNLEFDVVGIKLKEGVPFTSIIEVERNRFGHALRQIYRRRYVADYCYVGVVLSKLSKLGDVIHMLSYNWLDIRSYGIGVLLFDVSSGEMVKVRRARRNWLIDKDMKEVFLSSLLNGDRRTVSEISIQER